VNFGAFSGDVNAFGSLFLNFEDSPRVSLLAAILDASGQGEKAQALASVNIESEGGLVVPWEVSTKYYSTVLDFWVLASTWDPTETTEDIELNREGYERQHDDGEDNGQEDLGADVDPSGLSAGDWAAVGGAVDAIALVVDHKQPPLPEFLASWSAFVERFAPAVQVCIGFNDHSKDDEETHEVFEWCISNGFEYIKVAKHETKGDTVTDGESRGV
jgi:hypothetical protein